MKPYDPTFALRLRRRLGIAIREHREKLGETQAEFGKRAKLGRTYVGALERGKKNLCLDTLSRVSFHLHLPLSTLILRAERPNGRT